MTRDEFIINNIDKLSRVEIQEYLKINDRALNSIIYHLRKKGLIHRYVPPYKLNIEFESKICTVCFTEKPLELFHNQKISKDGKRAVCKECRAIMAKNTNPITWAKRKKKISENPILKAKLAIAGRIYRLNNKEKIQERNRKYGKSVKDSRKIYLNKYLKQRREIDINFKLRLNWHKRIWDALNGTCCSNETMNVLGIGSEELRNYIQSKFKDGMNWNNYGKNGIWELDHIRPASIFDLTDYSQLCLCFHYTNLQPLFRGENMRKFNNNVVLQFYT